MKLEIKKEVIAGLIISAIILGICWYQATDGGGPCNAGIGFFISLFIIIASLILSGVLLLIRNASISLIGKTIMITTLIGAIILFATILYN